MSVIKLKSNLCTTHIERRDRETEMAASIKHQPYSGRAKNAPSLKSVTHILQ